MHTPGHTPGSQCILINENRLLSGDTMFIGNIGRLDMAGADIPQAFESIKKLCQLNESIVVYPGHNYGGSYTTIKQEKTSNPMLQAPNLEEFQQLVAMSNPKKP
jgi:glyoxylase-like metal-dependent hydrolase (beta-lactamase superfamily II)